MKYSTSKIDDCAVVCLFLDPNTGNPSSSVSPTKEKELWSPTGTDKEEDGNGHTALYQSATVRTDEGTLKVTSKEHAEGATEDDMLLDAYSASALEGVTRVNTLLNLPRCKPGK